MGMMNIVGRLVFTSMTKIRRTARHMCNFSNVKCFFEWMGLPGPLGFETPDFSRAAMCSALGMSHARRCDSDKRGWRNPCYAR